jgi:6-phosphogluconolactonase
MYGKKNLKIFESVDALNEAAANMIVEIAKKAIDARGRFTVALSGGNTPKQLYTLLSTPQYSAQINWQKTFIFWGDERCVPAIDEQNNAHMAKQALLDKINIPASNIHPVPVQLPPVEAAESYEVDMLKFFNSPSPMFDLILLGLGENGHTASLFPGTDVLRDQAAGIRALYIDEVKMFRITMTAPLINLSHHILFLVTGKGKAEVLKNVITGAYHPEQYPAQLIKPEKGKLFWLVDKEAGQDFTGL